MNLEIKGLATKLQFFENYAKDLQTNIQKEMNDWANNTASQAIALAPADEGFLRNSIKPDYGDLEASVVVRADYGAYLEFGTRKFAAQYVSTLPNEWQTFAAQFKVPGGGNFEEFIIRLVNWIHRKGLGSGFGGRIGIAGTYSVKTRKRTGSKSTQAAQDKQLAYVIARSILINGIPAQPYLYPAANNTTPVLLENIQKVING